MVHGTWYAFTGHRPVDVDESETVPHVLLHLAAVVLLAVVGSTKSDGLPVLSSPGDGRPARVTVGYLALHF